MKNIWLGMNLRVKIDMNFNFDESGFAVSEGEKLKINNWGLDLAKEDKTGYNLFSKTQNVDNSGLAVVCFAGDTIRGRKAGITLGCLG